MKGTNQKRTLIVSAAIILLCMGIIMGTTFALFTDRRSVSHHLQAGDLTITLKRTELVKKTLNTDGYLVSSPADKTEVNFTDTTTANRNVFDIGTDEKVVPGTKYVAKMQVENHSDVAFRYWVEIVCTDKTNGEDLAKQLKVTVNTGSDTSDFVGNGLVVKGANGYVGELAVGKTGTFVVTVEFLDSFVDENNMDYYDNDLAKNEKLSFDLVVHAVQVTDAP